MARARPEPAPQAPRKGAGPSAPAKRVRGLAERPPLAQAPAPGGLEGALARLDVACARLIGGGRVNHQAVAKLVAREFPGAEPVGAGGHKTVFAVSPEHVVKVGAAADVQETWDTYAWLPREKRLRLWAPLLLRGRHVVLQARGEPCRVTPQELVRWQRLGRGCGLVDLNPDNLMRVAGRTVLVDARLSGIALRRLAGQRKSAPVRLPEPGELVADSDDPAIVTAAPPPVARAPWEVLGLTVDEERFCQEYVGDAHENATAATHRAGLQVTRQSARSVGMRLLQKPAVRERVAQLKAAVLREAQKRVRTPITAERILQEWAGMAFADRRLVHVIQDDGQVRIAPTSEWSEEAASAVAGVRQGADGVVTVEFHDKDRALAHLARYLRMFPEHVGVAGQVQVGQAVIYIPDNGRDPEFAVQPGGAQTNGHAANRAPEPLPPSGGPAAAGEAEGAAGPGGADDLERELGLDG